jgi:hypothetical protein
MPKSLFDQLCEAANIKLQEDETFKTFASRGAAKVNKLSQEKWDELTEPLQKWVNGTLEAIDKKQDLPELKGFPEPAADDGAEAGDETEHDPETGEVTDEGEGGTDAGDAEPDAEPEDGVDGEAEMEQEAASSEDGEPAGKIPKRGVKPKKKSVAKKVATPKPAKEKVVKKAAKATGRTSLNGDSRIKVLVKENPYREGTGRYKRWAKLKDGMTVAQALKVGFEPVNLRYCVADGHIKIVA